MKDTKQKGFSLMELMAVVIIILIMLAVTTVNFANSRPSIKVRRDASQMVSFLRNMWDATKTTGAPLILQPDYEKGTLTYTSPRQNQTRTAKFESNSRLVAFKLNDRLYSQASMDVGMDDQQYNDAFFDSGIYLSEGRGITRIAVVFGIAEEEDTPLSEYTFLTMCTLNLITGKGEIINLTHEEVASIFESAQDAEDNLDQ